jgi:hypothetical protein
VPASNWALHRFTLYLHLLIGSAHVVVTPDGCWRNVPVHQVLGQSRALALRRRTIADRAGAATTTSEPADVMNPPLLLSLRALPCGGISSSRAGRFCQL